jgi:hypothetical protein
MDNVLAASDLEIAANAAQKMKASGGGCGTCGSKSGGCS